MSNCYNKIENYFNFQKKTKFEVPTTEGIFKKLFIGVIFLVLLICFIAPYLNPWMSKTSTTQVFGFRNFRAFIYALGLPLSLFSCSAVLILASKYIKEKTPKLIITTIGFMFNYTSIFHFVWIFWSDNNLTKVQYYVSIGAISAIFTVVFVVFYKYYKTTLSKFQKALKPISRFAFIGVKKHIHPDHYNAYEEDSVKTLKKACGGKKYVKTL